MRAWRSQQLLGLGYISGRGLRFVLQGLLRVEGLGRKIWGFRVQGFRV